MIVDNIDWRADHQPAAGELRSSVEPIIPVLCEHDVKNAPSTDCEWQA